MADISDTIRTASTQLARAMAPIEEVFLSAGGHLTSAVETLGRLNEGFAGVARRMEDADALAAFDNLAGLSRDLGQLNAGTQASQTRLEEMGALTKTVANRIDRLRKTMGEVRVLAINAKVEAAHISVRDVDFTVFTQEIGRLAAMADDTLGVLAGELGGLSASLDGARANLASFGRDQGHALAAVSARLGNGLDAVAARRRDAADSVAALGEGARQMMRRVAEMVEVLQVGDVTRQRAEHVCEALATLLDVLGRGDGLSEGHKAVLTATVCRLQSAQAEQAGAELAADLARLGGTLGNLSDDITGLPRRCAAIQGAAGDGSSSFLSELSHELEQADHLLHRYAEARAGLDDVVSRISSVVEGMVRHVEAIGGIEADMRVMGLNATFKCSRLGGQGRGLSVIAQELRGYSNRTAEDSTAVMASLDRLIIAARDTSDNEGGHQASVLETAMSEAVTALDRIGAEIGRSLADLSRQGSTATGQLANASSLLGGQEGFAAALKECGRVLGSLAAEDRGEDMDDIRAEVMDLLRSRYTMESERRVHEMLGEADSSRNPAPVSAETTDPDDFLF